MSGSTTDTRRWARPTEDRLDGPQKSLPDAADGRHRRGVPRRRPRLSEFSTPLLVLDDAAIDAQHRRGWPAWCAEHGVELAPHGKTTMAPALWERQLRRRRVGDHASPPRRQLRVAVAARGAPGAAGQRAGRPGRARPGWPALLDADPELEVLTWADSVRHGRRDGRRAGADCRRPGPPGDRAGRARAPPAAAPAPATWPTARAVADAVAASAAPAPGRGRRLRGRAGPRRRPGRARRAVRALPAATGRAARRLRDAGGYPEATSRASPRAAAPTSTTSPTCSARWPDPAPAVLLRSGAYLIHDDGFYRGDLPVRAAAADGAAVPLGDARLGPGGLPPRARAGPARRRQARRPVRRGPARAAAGRRRSSGRRPRPLAGAEVTAVNDQHAFLRLGPGRPRCGSGTSCGWACPTRAPRSTSGAGSRWSRATTTRPGGRRPGPDVLLIESHATLIRSATVVDGTETPRYRADVLVDGDRIAEIRPERRPRPAADRVIDADGLVLAPGLHRHARPLRPADPARTRRTWPRSARASPPRCSARTGCPTPRSTTTRWPMLRRKIAGWNTDPAGLRLLLAHASASTSTGSTRGIAGNAAYLVPHGVVRALVVGWDDVPATPADIAAMQRDRRAPRWPRARSGCPPG